MRGAFSRAIAAVMHHNVLVVVLMLVASAGVVYGITDLEMGSNTGGGDAIGETEEFQKLEYIRAHYANRSSNTTDREPAVVYVRDADGNVLSKTALEESLEYQQAALANESVSVALVDGGATGGHGGVVGVSNLVATRLAGDRDATLDEQIDALDAASDAEVERAVEATLAEGSPALELLAEGSPALELLPNDYEPGTASADSRRLVFQFAAAETDAAASESEDAVARSQATRAIYELAGDRDSAATYFTIGEHAVRDRNRLWNQNTMELIVPAALLAILAVLAFSYRDVVDVAVGFTGVVLSVLWMFGILGWLGVPAGMTLVVGPVLIVGLSVDYGLHVFMRYREQRGEDDGIREPMARGVASVGVALALVTVTTAVGFLANVTTDFTLIRQLAVGITLGVISSFVIFLTIVPALKVTIDGLLERVGLDRRKRPLGKNRFVEPVLAVGATAARRAAPAVVVLALVVGAAGGLAWMELDRESVQTEVDGVAEWKQDLPEPFVWDVHPLGERTAYVADHYRAPDEHSQQTSQILIEGDVTADGTLDELAAARSSLAESDVVFARHGEVAYVSPSSVMRSVAAENEEFAATLADADTDDDGVPDENLGSVYDALYDAAPDRAGLVVERTDGDYRSVRMMVPVKRGTETDTRAAVMREAADTIETDAAGDLEAIAIGRATVNAAETQRLASNILETLVLALGAVGVILALGYRGVEGSASLGAVTAVPITLVLAFVVAGMYVLDVPLTLLTALLMSLVIGLGIDYNIHVSDRFAQELHAGRSVHDALHEAVTGTGGALLGSTLTSTGAFAALLLHPHPQFTSFGALVVLALGTSFLVSVYVLPSVLALWARYSYDDVKFAADAGTPEASPGD
jgi:predicted RND superfamily exporter protein